MIEFARIDGMKEILLADRKHARDAYMTDEVRQSGFILTGIYEV
jgi:hypothetical protein